MVATDRDQLTHQHDLGCGRKLEYMRDNHGITNRCWLGGVCKFGDPVVAVALTVALPLLFVSGWTIFNEVDNLCSEHSCSFGERRVRTPCFICGYSNQCGFNLTCGTIHGFVIRGGINITRTLSFYLLVFLVKNASVMGDQLVTRRRLFKA